MPAKTAPVSVSVRSSVEYATLEELLQNTRSERVRTEFYKIPEEHYTEMNEIRIWVRNT